MIITHRDDRHVDRVPAKTGYTGIGEVFPFYVPSSVEISVEFKPTALAQENRLCGSVPPVRISAARASLASMPRIYGLYFRACIFSFVGNKAAKLIKTPRVVAASLPPSALFSAATNVSQVFNDDDAARFHGLNDALAQNVVAIFPKPCLPSSHLLEMAFCRPAAFGLKTATKTEVPFIDLLPLSFAQESSIGQDCWSVDAEVYANSLASKFDLRRLDCQNNVKPPPARSTNKVCAVKPLRSFKQPTHLLVHFERELYPAKNGGKAHNLRINFHPVGSGVISDSSPNSSRDGHFLSIFLACKDRFQRLRSLHSRRDNKLAWKCWMFRPKRVIRSVMKFNAVLRPIFPAIFRHSIEACSRPFNGLCQDKILFRCRLKSEAYRPLHGSYIDRLLRKINPSPPKKTMFCWLPVHGAEHGIKVRFL